MKRTRALRIGVVAYFASMVLGLVVNTMMGFEMQSVNALPVEMWVVSLVVLFCVGMGAALWYFAGKHTHISALHGLYLGGMMVFAGFLFDMLTISLFYVSGDIPPGASLWDLYTQIRFRISIVLMLGTTTLVGWYKAK